MPCRNPNFGPLWIAANPRGVERPAHTKADAEAFERGEIDAATLDARNAEIETATTDIAVFYANNASL